MNDETIWQKREEEYLRLLKEADERYNQLSKELKQEKRNINLVWIGWTVLLLAGWFFYRNSL